ncbi:MAG: hypothetical protein HQ564_09365 [Candidatus Saganbacteria bacterium]|nr:hypothetical protein [Candidatus Saganbacteria bacterium]
MKKVGGQLQDLNLNKAQQNLVKNKLPQSLVTTAKNVDWLNAVAGTDSALQSAVDQLPSDVAHIVLEREGKVEFLSLTELEALDTAGLDEAAVVDQLAA